MNRKIVTVTPDMGLNDVVKFLLKHGRSNAPVVEERDGHQTLVGLVSEADCLEHYANAIFYGIPTPPETVGMIMQKHPVCVPSDTDVFTLASVLAGHRLRHVPIVDDQHLIGIVSRRDVLKALDSYQSAQTEAADRDRSPLDIRQIANLRFVAERRD